MNFYNIHPVVYLTVSNDNRISNTTNTSAFNALKANVLVMLDRYLVIITIMSVGRVAQSV
jgi:hypothetical protein